MRSEFQHFQEGIECMCGHMGVLCAFRWKLSEHISAIYIHVRDGST